MNLSTILRLITTTALVVLMWRRVWWVVPLLLTLQYVSIEFQNLAKWATSRMVQKMKYRNSLLQPSPGSQSPKPSSHAS